jgi:hypothetical protein
MNVGRIERLDSNEHNHRWMRIPNGMKCRTCGEVIRVSATVAS